MKLYYSPGACSLAPHIVLQETGAQFDLVRVDTSTHRYAGDKNFLDVNPKGYVPVLQLSSGEILTEGPVIVQYVADLAQRHDLMPPAGTLARYRIMEWQNYITSEIHKSFSPLFGTAYSTETKTTFANSLRKKLGWVASRLEGQPYLTGTTFTAADAYLFVTASWSAYARLDISDLKPLQSFIARVADRPAVQTAMRAEGLKGT